MLWDTIKNVWSFFSFSISTVFKTILLVFDSFFSFVYFLAIKTSCRNFTNAPRGVATLAKLSKGHLMKTFWNKRCFFCRKKKMFLDERHLHCIKNTCLQLQFPRNCLKRKKTIFAVYLYLLSNKKTKISLFTLYLCCTWVSKLFLTAVWNVNNTRWKVIFNVKLMVIMSML